MTRAQGRREMADEKVDTAESLGQKTVKTEFFNQHEGLRGRDPNVMYLDVAERLHGAETAKALGFDVETKDAGALPVTAGTPLVTKARLGENLVSHPNAALLSETEDSAIHEGTDPVVTAEVPVEEDGTASPFLGVKQQKVDGEQPGNPAVTGYASTDGTTAANTPSFDAGTPAANDPVNH